MSAVTKIAWCDSTFNPWIGCTEISTAKSGGGGCDHCYARQLDARKRWGGITHWGAGVPRYRTKDWKKPLRWNAEAAKTGERWTVFPSLCDPFDNEVPMIWRHDLWQLIRDTPYLTWLLLSKRIGNVEKMWPPPLLPNIWLGASIVNQEELRRDWPKLRDTPAAKRFISYEPAIASVDWCEALGIWWNSTLREWVREDVLRPDQIIVGGESDQGKHKARPFDIEWARSTIRQCRAAGVSVFCKQIGSNAGTMLRARCGTWERFPTKERAGADPAEWPADLRVQEIPT